MKRNLEDRNPMEDRERWWNKVKVDMEMVGDLAVGKLVKAEGGAED